ncbi:MAG: U3 snoRNP protein, partial [Pleopsidium flavum]
MLEDMLEILGNRLKPFVNMLVNAVLYCLIRASRDIPKAVDAEEEKIGEYSQLSMSRAVRQTGFKCLNMLFKTSSDFEWSAYMPAIMAELVMPRLERLPIDTAQAVSVLLQLFSTWSSSQETVFFLATEDGKALQKIAECLDVPSAKDEVKLFVLENILQNIIKLASGQLDGNQASSADELCTRINAQVLRPNVDYFLARIGSLLRKSPSRELLGSGVRVVSQLAEFVTCSSQARNFIEIAAFLLNQPVHRINPKTKGDLLRILQHFIPECNIADDEDLQAKVYNLVSSLFGYFKDSTSRETLCRVLAVLARNDQEVGGVAALCADLNSFSVQSLDEPDFDRRLRAFSIINEEQYPGLTIKQWRPILFNALYYIRDDKELSIRTSASLTLRRFIESVPVGSGTSSPAALELVTSHLLPSLRKGAHDSSELVRAEYVAVMAYLVKQSSQWCEVNDMLVLLVDDDEEASFFNNVLHIQQHRRLRALRRLAGEARQGHLHSTNITQFFVPLIEHFIFDKADDDSAHNLAAEALLTIGVLVEWVEWAQFRAMFRRYSSYMQSKPDMEKTIIKLLGMMIDGLCRAARSKQTHLPSSMTMVDWMVVRSDADVESEVGTQRSPSMLAATTPKQQKLSDDLTNNLLPPLKTYLHNKDESTVSLRVPVAVAIVKLLKLLPHEQLSHHLPPVLTDLSHILRSRSQESRDMTRKTLAEISTLIGPSYFGFVLKELRGALARGYQLHVLSYTVHSILVATASSFNSGDLDYCMPQIVSVIMDDIFGATGQEKDAEEYISKMKEVKSSKSYDSMELIAKTTTLRRLSDLIRPLQTLLQEKLTLNLVKKIDELLRRVGVGLLRNEAIQSRDLLVFCYEVVQEVYKVEAASRSSNSREDYRIKRYLINVKGANKNEQRGSTSSYTYKLARFSLDVLRSTLHKYDILQAPSNLVGFLPIIGDAIVQSQEEVQISAIRLLTTIIKVPLPELDQTAIVAATEGVKMIKASTSTNTEIAQAALKLISAILRERRHVTIRESDVAYLLKRLKPDLEEPDRQGVTFNFLKAVLTRKIVITEVYEVLDIVAAIMVTNQTRGARDLARGVYFQFLMDYPQSKDRFSKQLGFLVKNLDYKHQEGRQSVMEAVHLLLSKVGHDLTQEIIAMFFVPLVMVLINDESAECREMAGVLLKELFERADEERTQTFLALLRAWLSQDEEPLLTRVSLQSYRIYFDINGTKSDKQRPYVQARLLTILKTNAVDVGSADWELVYFALKTIATLCQLFPNALFAANSAPLWAQVRLFLSFPHAWVKLSAAKLVGLYIADYGRANADTGLRKLPLTGTSGLELTAEDILHLARASVGILRVPGVSEELASQSVRNLVFLGRCMAANELLWSTSNVSEKFDDEEDSEDEKHGLVNGHVGSKKISPAIQFLFERLSAILRRETLTTRTPSLVPKTASLQLVAALCSHLPLTALSPCLQTILLPLHNLTDPSIPAPYSTDQAFETAYKALVSTSQEILALLQQKVGTTEFVAQLAKVREEVKARREGRRVKRRIEAVAEPEK